MLRALGKTRQIPGEAPRRWYFCQEIDLVVWFDEDETPTAFQLAYDKYDGEHSIAWHPQRGYQHYRVDDGEGTVCSSATPFLHANGPFPQAQVLAKFLALAGELPPAIGEFVADRLRKFDGPRLVAATRQRRPDPA